MIPQRVMSGLGAPIMDPHIGHHKWYGINCGDADNTIKLELLGNGMPGTLTPNISTLRSPQVLDLNDNAINVRHVMVHMVLWIGLRASLFLT